MISKFFQFVLLGLALFFAYWATPLRIYNLENRVPHADEGEQSFTAARLIQDSKYEYNPNGPHGPILYYWASATLPESKAESFDIPDLRRTLLPIFYMTLALLFASALFARDEKLCFKTKGREISYFSKSEVFKFVGATAAVGLLCLSSLSAIYSTYFVQETFFALFGFAFCVAGAKFLKSPNMINAAAVGLFAGMLQITKETSVVAFASLFIAWILCDVSSKKYRSDLAQFVKSSGSKNLAKIFLCALVPALFVYTIFYSSFGENPQGIVDGIKCYFTHFAEKSASAAHSKEFSYYFNLLIGAKSQGAIFGESAIFVLSIPGTCFAFALKNRLVKYVSTFAWLNIILMSFFSYKTPWLLLMPLTCLCLVGGYAIRILLSLRTLSLFKTNKSLAISFAITMLVAVCGASYFLKLQQKEQRNAARNYACDPRNPMIYVHTLKSEERLVNRIKDCAKVADANFKVLVITKNSPWPLPWQLLRLDCADFASDISQIKNLSDYSIVVYDAPFTDYFKAKFDDEKFLEEFFGLRENILLRAKVRRDIFEKSIQ